jgi:hypothetical protein
LWIHTEVQFGSTQSGEYPSFTRARTMAHTVPSARPWSVLPKKALPYVAAAIAGAVGLSVFRERRRDAALQDVERKRQELAKHDELLMAQGKEVSAAQRDHAALKARKELEIRDSQRQVLLIEAEARANRQQRTEDVKRINELHGAALDAEFDQVMQKLDKGERT